ncbi:MAG TPA: class I SAM-dependent methyltransferase [Candidatus Binatia bacterium]|nr:class I SAM-dependent methyltransferase [Candidatus Binatia bacterium]
MVERHESASGERAPSRTALTAALMRAVHTRRDRPRAIDDPWGDRLVSREEKAALYRRVLDGASAETRARLESLGSEQAAIDAALRAHPTYGGVVLRSRWAEDALERAVARGARQYVLVGAGFDSFIVRQPPYARDVGIFEVDHPASQALKRARLAEAGADVPANVRFVAADLARESLADALGRSGFARSVPAFFSWLGVTIYLTRAANLATLRAIAEASAPGSEVAFTYADERALAGPGFAALARTRAKLAAAGEPWRSGFDPSALADELRPLGLSLVEDLDREAIRARLAAEIPHGLSPGPNGHFARARVLPKLA